MLTEEALILLATLGASGLLVLGVVELAWPSTPRRPVRRARVTPPARFETPWTAAPVAFADEAAVAVAEPPPAVARAEAEVADSTVIEPESLPPAIAADDLPRVVEGPVMAEVVAAPPPRPEPPRPKVLPVDTCLAMYNDGRFSEVVSLGSAALEVHARMAAVSDRPHEAAALVDLVGLSKQQLGDRKGARAAFAAAIRDADASVRSTYVDHLVALVREVAEDGDALADGDAERVRELRAGVVALEDALRVAPGDEGLVAAQSALRDALSPACERLVARVVAGDGDDQARALVLEALADDAMPVVWRDRLREQLAAASSAEIGQLTAQAIRSVQDGKDGEALELLERAEQLAAALPGGVVADERREELERRLWWGYTKVGLRRVETGNVDGAVEPLFRALHLGGIDEDRLGETRSALVRALEGVVDARCAAIQQLAFTDARGAQAELEQLSAFLRASADHGLGDEDLADASAKVAQLEQALAPTSSPN
jgi:hypothetical protein